MEMTELSLHRHKARIVAIGLRLTIGSPSRSVHGLIVSYAAAGTAMYADM
jgi:hypothetical protein